MHTRHPIIVITSVLALALAAGLVLAHSARATLPGRNGLIVFAAPVASSHKVYVCQIFAMNPDGSGVRQLTRSATPCWDPSISVNGRTIVFGQSKSTKSEDYGDEICAMTTTGADPRHLATGWGCGRPSFSPNGRQVTFVNENQVWVMNADGSHQRRFSALPSDMQAWSPTYSPNGKTVVFVASIWVAPSSAKNRSEILAMNADGTHLRRLAYATEPNFVWNTNTPLWGVSFSPDGRKIVYSAHTRKHGYFLRVMNADGSDQHLLPRSYGFTWPCYSPDGRQILCVNGHGQISVVRTNGTHWRRLTHIAGPVWTVDWGPHVR